MVIKRITTGIIAGLIAGIVIWAGEPWFTIILCLLSAASAYEFFRIIKNEQVQPITYLGIIFSILIVLNTHSTSSLTLPLLLVLATLIPLTWMIFRNHKDTAFISWAWTLGGIIYTGGLLSFYIPIRAMDNGMGWVFMIAAGTAFCDVFAYAIGSIFGKHPLAASISPGKTWEGCAGGMAGAIIFSVALSYLFKLPLNIWQMIIAGIIISVFAELGDLVESLLKRNMKTKDTGNLLPGHGGLLDRIDSHLFVVPVAYYLIVLLNSMGWLSG
jgi:phosphatidate cytidylyltransferase